MSFSLNVVDPATRSAEEKRKLELQINAERYRRIEEGVVVTLSNSLTTVRLQGRPQDMQNLQALAFAAQLRISQGDTTTTSVFRDMDNVDHDLTPPQILELFQKGAGWVEAVYQASWTLKDMDPIPGDFTSDTYWPPATVA